MPLAGQNRRQTESHQARLNGRGAKEEGRKAKSDKSNKNKNDFERFERFLAKRLIKQPAAAGSWTSQASRARARLPRRQQRKQKSLVGKKAFFNLLRQNNGNLRAARAEEFAHSAESRERFNKVKNSEGELYNTNCHESPTNDHELKTFVRN